MAENILSVEKLKIGFWNEKRVLTAVEDISFEVQKGKTLCIVGESGCGKSVTATSILRLWPQKSVVIQGGSILFHGQDLTKCGPKQMDQIRGNKISMIFQEPIRRTASGIKKRRRNTLLRCLSGWGFPPLEPGSMSIPISCQAGCARG